MCHTTCGAKKKILLDYHKTFYSVFFFVPFYLFSIWVCDVSVYVCVFKPPFSLSLHNTLWHSLPLFLVLLQWHEASSSMLALTKSLTNCFRLLGSRAGLWCSNPPSLQREADCGSRERARWAATGCGEPDVSLPLSSAPVQSALTIQAVVEHLWNQSVCTIVLTANDFL